MSNNLAAITFQGLQHTICYLPSFSNPLLIQLRFWLWIMSLLILHKSIFFTLSRGQPRGIIAPEWSSSERECFDLWKMVSADLRDEEQHEPPFPHIDAFHSNGPKMLSPVTASGSWPRVQTLYPPHVWLTDSLTSSFMPDHWPPCYPCLYKHCVNFKRSVAIQAPLWAGSISQSICRKAREEVTHIAFFLLCKEEHESSFKVLHKSKLSPVCALNVNKNEKVVGVEATSQLLIGTVSSVSFSLTDGEWKGTTAIGILANSPFNTFKGCQEAEFK